MAQTRGTTGNSKPRIFTAVSTEPARKRSTTTKKKAAPKPKTGAGVTKKSATATTPKKPTLKEKVEGAVKKVVAKVEGKPGKKAAGTKKTSGANGHGGRATKNTAVKA